MKSFKNINTRLLLTMSVIGLTSCTKSVVVPAPSTEITSESVFNDNKSTEAVMTGLYSIIQTQQTLAGGPSSIGTLQGLAADELEYNGVSNQVCQAFYQNSYNNTTQDNYYANLYSLFYTINSVIENASASEKLSPSVKKQMVGEAYFMRAFLNFYLVNLFGDVPLVTTTNYQTNNLIARSPKSQIYQQIIADLKLAQNMLPDHFVDQQGNPSNEHIRPNKWAATALLARAYLYYNNDYQDAAAQATLVINNSGLSIVQDLDQVFLANSNEAIWQMYPADGPSTNADTFDGYFYPITQTPVDDGSTARGLYSISPFLLNTFEPGDKRKVNWINSFTDPGTGKVYYYPYKYKEASYNGSSLPEYEMVLRLSEQYLIRAEAEANNGDPTDAINDLNMIRSRAGLSGYNGGPDPTSLQAAILHERQVEFFTEWGHRWFDLIRTGNINSVMGASGQNVCASKGGAWNPEFSLLPFAYIDLKANNKLVQNPGY